MSINMNMTRKSALYLASSSNILVNSNQSMRRYSSWLQDGCLTAMPVLRLRIHPEMERPATLNRSKPSTAGATKSNPAFRIPTVSQSLDEEHNLHVWEKAHLMESSFPRRFCTSAHILGQVLIFQGQTCPLGRAFTT